MLFLSAAFRTSLYKGLDCCPYSAQLEPQHSTHDYIGMKRQKVFRTFADSAENVTESRQRESGFMAGGHQLRSIMIYLFGAAMDCPFTMHLMK